MIINRDISTDIIVNVKDLYTIDNAYTFIKLTDANFKDFTYLVEDTTPSRYYSTFVINSSVYTSGELNVYESDVSTSISVSTPIYTTLYDVSNNVVDISVSSAINIFINSIPVDISIYSVMPNINI